MSTILVTPLSAVQGTILSRRPSHLVTLLSPEHMIETPSGFRPDRHLRLALNDISETWAGEAPPAAHHIESLLAFGRGWKAHAPILVHCWAGVSRSTAAAYILLCDRHEPGLELQIAKALRYRAPHACPNSLMVGLADEILGRNGRMTAAIAAIGRGVFAAEGERVELPVHLEDL